MSLTFLILAVGVKEKLEKNVELMKDSVSYVGGKTVDVHYVSYNVSYDGYKITKYLETSCDTNKANIIVIIGESKITTDIEAMSIISRVVSRTKSDKTLTSAISELETILQAVLPLAVCGIRKKTLILNMFGECLTAAISLQANQERLLQIIDIIQLMQNNTTNKSLACDTPKPCSILKIKHIEKFKETLFPMISVTQAIKIICEKIIKGNEEIEHECVSVHVACGRILSKDIYSECNVPSFRTSAKCGYAIKANDGENIKKILNAESSIEPGTCIFVKTGAPIPDEATAVVQVENTKEVIKECDDNNTDDIEEEKEEKEEEIEIIIQPKEGENIRPIGYEIKKKDLILEEHKRIGPAEIGLLTYCGVSEVVVIKHQVVGIISIGDELEEPGEILKIKHDYDSSRLILITLLKQQDFDSLDFGITNDNMVSIISKIEEALEKVNVLVTIGSANDKDLLKPILKGYFNATIHFGNVDMTPGKSTTYATCRFRGIKKYFLCLSKNPATVPIVTHLFILPLLNELRCFMKSPPLVQARVQTSPILHSRPKYIWTSLKWNNKNNYARIYDTANHYNPNANTLLRLPPRTVYESRLLPDAFVTTTFCGSK
ncbi:unnamed protein product [Lasius platythorax]|uniref:molybdopterin adenylyltransferase n=1 Tax=Lasius platythorax TaxID=488582 RepID=A0AAV2N7U0_9HYME